MDSLLEKSKQFARAGRDERLEPPQMVQKTSSVRHPKTSYGRRAQVQSISTYTFTCKLYKETDDSTATGETVTVYPVEHHGSNGLDGDVWPKYSENEVMSVFQDLNGNWYTSFPFDDVDKCD